ncbi:MULTISPECIES: hypothetical protein [unclassified Lentimonas]|uniref:hypothetical protein n=1 Tax=unclassified Lentimonas TaxID=2630993 RepID=UPI00132C64E3|nr:MULTISPECIES: hypothetical protein [unclassified Lentimonas]CAA6692716.1 Unannotated [Lentimonas sp. CC10]CAA6696718.1 Unannotated [Lentimonas sp. CC19]CAA7072302.1 Unannotated [Lentimonas sp. CC11]
MLKPIQLFRFAALLAIASASVFADSKSLQGSRPNIILVMTDDQGSLLSCMGHPMLQTPNIDRFSEKSERLCAQ